MVKSDVDVRLLNTGRISSFKRRIPNSASCGFTHVPASLLLTSFLHGACLYLLSVQCTENLGVFCRRY